jgi:hypothetical protein
MRPDHSGQLGRAPPAQAAVCIQKASSCKADTRNPAFDRLFPSEAAACVRLLLRKPAPIFAPGTQLPPLQRRQTDGAEKRLTKESCSNTI